MGKPFFTCTPITANFIECSVFFSFSLGGTFFYFIFIFAGQHLKVAARSERSLRENQAKQEMTQTSLFVDVVQLIEHLQIYFLCVLSYANERIP